MTATPIPRTLALTLYGELDVSVIDELPPGRKPIRTALRGNERREAIFEFAGDQVRQGRQVYVVYPLIEESEKMDYKSAVEAYDELRYGPLAEFSVALLHGRMAAEEKAAVMEDFKQNRVQVLVCTTVVEVGVDVPNATVMIIRTRRALWLGAVAPVARPRGPRWGAVVLHPHQLCPRRGRVGGFARAASDHGAYPRRL